MTFMKKTIDDYLTEIRGLLLQYHKLAREIRDHRNDKENQHSLRLLEERLLLLKQNLRGHNLTEAQRQQKFLEHHLAAIRQANEHMNQLNLTLEYSMISEELEDLKDEMNRLLEDIEREKQQLQEQNRSSINMAPSPTPSGSRGNDEEGHY